MSAKTTFTHGRRCPDGAYIVAEGLTFEQATDCLSRLGGFVEPDRDVEIVPQANHGIPVCPQVSPARFAWLAACGMV